jgi:hypothetical protein
MSRPTSTRLSAISGHIETSTRQSLDSQNNSAIMSSTQVADHLPWNPNNAKFPSRKDLPKLSGAPEGAAWVWGKNDEVCAPDSDINMLVCG